MAQENVRGSTINANNAKRNFNSGVWGLHIFYSFYSFFLILSHGTGVSSFLRRTLGPMARIGSVCVFVCLCVCVCVCVCV